MKLKSTREMICEIGEFAKKTPWVKRKFKGTTKAGTPAYCVLGYCDAYIALNFYTWNPSARLAMYKRVISQLRKTLRKLHPSFGNEIPAFNDHPTTRKKDVIALFEEACKS